MTPSYFQMRDFHKALNADVMKKSAGNPPWVKDACGQFEDPEYGLLSLAERGLLKDLRLLAARRANKILDDENYLRAQLRCTPRARLRTKLHRLRAYGFIEDYNPQHNPAAKELNPSRDNLEDIATVSSAEESREEDPPSPPSGGANGKPTLGAKDLRRYTGWKRTRSTAAEHYIKHPLGTDKPPASYPDAKPTRDQVLAALQAEHDREPDAGELEF